MRRRKKRSKYNRQKEIIILSLFLIITCLSMGYANFTTNINFTAKGNISTTSSSCFTVSDNGDGTGTITDYDVDTCGKKVNIPNKINNLTITKIVDGISRKVDNGYYNTGPFVEKGINIAILPDTIEYIGAIAFFGDDLKKIVIPSSVREIGWQAFAFNQIENLTLNEGILTIGFEAFAHNNLKTIKIPNSITTLSGGVFNTNLLNDDEVFVYNKKEDGTIDYTSLNSYGNRNVKEIIFPENIKILDSHSLYLLNNLTEINIPDTVEELKSSVFYNNKQLKTINIGSGIKTIASNTFYGISNEETLTININRKKDSISGTPWGAENAVINWTGTN